MLSREDVLRMAQQAADETPDIIVIPHEFSIRFAALVEAEVTERCAKVAEEYNEEGRYVAMAFAAAIRARAGGA